MAGRQTSRQLGRLAGKALEAARPAVVRDRAAAFGRLLQAEYRSGRDGTDDDATAASVAAAMRRVDWSRVRRVTADRTSAAAEQARQMAAQVDWERVTPAAAEVASALIAAVASGQLGLGGAMGSRVVRTIVNERDLALRVAAALHAGRPSQQVGDFRTVIDTTATDT